MGKKKTPLIQRLRETGGTLVVFPSASEDIGLNLQATTTGVAMSHYALLNIPKLAIKNCIKECTKDIRCQGDSNLALAMSLQNYALNFETLLINQDKYNYQALSTVSEKAFWHWAMHVGILDSNKLKNLAGSYFIEKDFNRDPKIMDDTVIKCFGSIDAGNSLSTEFGMFNETYITVPTSWGAGPVYLKASDDDNFKTNYMYELSSTDHLEGRDDTYNYYSYTDGQDYPFFDTLINDKGYYKTDKIDGLEIVKDINTIQQLTQKMVGSDIIYSSYDDINIDSENIISIDEEFNFNAILLYYSTYDQDDAIKTAYATNLFGIIFLDGCRLENIDDDAFVIPTLKKRKSTSQHFGNSYSFRVNLKTMSVYDNTDAIIQDNTTTSGISAVEFSDAISNMNRAIDIMNSNLHTVQAIQDQYAAIMTQYDNFQSDIEDLSTCINAYLKGTRSAFVDTSILYANEIRPSEKSDSNTINIMYRSQYTDQSGNNIYQPAVSITNGYIYANDVNMDILHTNNNYVNITNTSICDKNIATINDQYTQNTNKTIDRMFNTSTDLMIKVRESDDMLFNSVYIDTKSPIFTTTEYGTNLMHLMDSDNNLDYTQLIPYMVRKIQMLQEEIQNLKKQIK
ncbi:MAG: hypothetical protein [Wendovervirus sonii]|uniref:Peptidase S74 domain-containing protein n=1 Tax=phage Lak_Megaphage_Sonny TaxID=3109229 RepID=A0ABZ0Z3R4_9CAUD|nr:MAG: hypothetical protein [phage Lak_Megaphage_Sonny]